MLDETKKSMKIMEMGGINLDKYSYNQLLKGLCKGNQLKEAYALVANEMEEKGCCDVVSCNILTEALCRVRNVRTAYKLFEETGRKGIDPDVVPYGTLIIGFFIKGNHKKAKELFDKMIDVGVMHTLLWYTTSASLAI